MSSNVIVKHHYNFQFSASCRSKGYKPGDILARRPEDINCAACRRADDDFSLKFNHRLEDWVGPAVEPGESMSSETLVELVHYAFVGNCRNHDGAKTTVIVEDVTCASCQENIYQKRSLVLFKYTVKKNVANIFYDYCSFSVVTAAVPHRNNRVTQDIREVSCVACLDALSKIVRDRFVTCLKQETEFNAWRKNWIGFWATLGEVVKVRRPRPAVSTHLVDDGRPRPAVSTHLVDDAIMKRFQLLELD